ncbi:MAG: protein-disulfide reductase DsbD family protein [Micavibrio sp.]
MEWFTLFHENPRSIVLTKYLRFLPSLALIACLAAPLCGQSAAARAEDGPYAMIRLSAEKGQVSAGETVTIAIEQTLAPGWHTYWVNPGDSGTPLEIFWTLPEGYSTGALQWPVPHKIPYAGLTNYGYEDHVVLLQDMTLPASLPAGPITLDAEVTVLVCKDICIPETSSHKLTFNDGSSNGYPEMIEKVRLDMPSTLETAAVYHEQVINDKNLLIVDIPVDSTNPLANIDHSSLSLLPQEWGIIQNSAPVSVVWDGERLSLRQERAERALKDIKNLPLLLTYKGENDHVAGFEIIAKQGEGAAAISASPVKTLPQSAALQGPEQSLSFITALLLAIAGGLVLNLMPCVFPVLSLKAISLSRMSEKEQSHAAASGMAYTAGVILSFGLIAAILMALKSAGAQIGWGFQLQNPTVVYALALLLFLIGLNLSGFFQIQGSFTNAGQSLTQKSGLKGAFFTGVLATLVATPCTAPFMGAAMGYALTQPPVLGMVIFVALGFGLALPYLLLTIVPPLRAALPKPGAWMETFKEFLAFPMYASAAWLIWVMAQQTDSMAIMSALWGMVGIAFMIWAWKHRPARQPQRLIVTGFALLLGACGLMAGFSETFKPMPSASIIQEEEGPQTLWQPFSQQKLDELLQGDAPVFVDMTAAWCITCKINERVALDIPRTRALFKEKGVIALMGDWTNQNPEITKFLESHGRKGVPLYVYYGPRDQDSGQRPETVVLPQILTPALVAEVLE